MQKKDNSTFTVDTTPKPRVYIEKIGDTSWELLEAQLDVHKDVTLWDDNPRLLGHLPQGGISSEKDLEAALQLTNGYDNLKKSIESIGQMEPIYAWRADDTSKYVVYEGATRVTILRELSQKYSGGPKAGKFDRVKVKILPPHFQEKERAILLARIHVRGTGVRAWGRYIEAKFIYDYVASKDALMSVADMANYMEKSISWVMRLRDAYQFALKFIDQIDDPSAEKTAVREFSTLEEISKVAGIGPLLRDYNNSNYDTLREEVFAMVQNGVFKEYRDARFLKQFYDDPEKWSLLKSGEKNIASKLAAEIKQGGSSIKARIAGLEQSLERTLQGDDHGIDDEDIDHLQGAIKRIQQRLHAGVSPFRLNLQQVTKLLSAATMADIKALPADELTSFKEAVGYFDMLAEKYGKQV